MLLDSVVTQGLTLPLEPFNKGPYEPLTSRLTRAQQLAEQAKIILDESQEALDFIGSHVNDDFYPDPPSKKKEDLLDTVDNFEDDLTDAYGSSGRLRHIHVEFDEQVSDGISIPPSSDEMDDDF